MNFKEAINKYYTCKCLTKKQLDILSAISSNDEKANKELRYNYINIQWSFVAISASLIIIFLAQWYISPQVFYIINQDSENNHVTKQVTREILLNFVKNIPPQVEVSSINDISKLFSDLKFKLIDPANYLPLKGCKIIGASYVKIGNSVGLFMLIEHPDSKMRFSIIQKPFTSGDELLMQSTPEANDGVNMRMLSENGVLTAIAW